MEQRLTEAAQCGNINAVYMLIHENPNLLEHIDDIPFVDTPLHIAASLGNTHFAVEIARLKPSFAKKLNPDGVSAIHLAIRYGHTETVQRLISIDSALIRVRGKDEVTPLQCAVEMGNVDLLAEFLYACPESIEDLNIRCESVVHVAVRNRKCGALKVLFGWLRRTGREEVLNWKDEEGNTVLHVAASTNQPQVVKLLIHKVNKNDKNLEGWTALDLALGLPREEDNTEVFDILSRAKALKGSAVPDAKTLADFLASPDGFLDHFIRLYCFLQMDLSVETRHVVLVVAVLIATATYQAVLSPPGGVWQSGTNPVSSNTTNLTTTTTANGKVVMGKDTFPMFMVLNTIAFTASIGVIFAVLPVRPYTLLLRVSLLFLLFSYSMSVEVISPPGNNSGILLASFALEYFLLLVTCRIAINVIERGFLWFKGKNVALHHIQMRRRVVGW